MTPLTAQELFDILSQLKDEGNELSQITINYRSNADSDVEVCTFVGEDLFDPYGNSRLASLVLMADGSEF